MLSHLAMRYTLIPAARPAASWAVTADVLVGRFDRWAATFRVDTDPELVDREQLLVWLDIGGRRLGVGDWRPQKSGPYGRFEVESIETLS